MNAANIKLQNWKCGLVKVIIHKLHPLIYSWFFIGCSLEMEGMGVCKENPILNNLQQAALQIHSVSEPSDHGFPRNPLVTNIRLQSVWRASPPWSLEPHAYLQTSANPPDETKDSSVLPMGKAAPTSGWNSASAKQGLTAKMEANNILKSHLNPGGSLWVEGSHERSVPKNEST